MATQKLNIDIVARDKSKQALNNLQGSLARVRQSVFNLRNAFIGLGAGLAIRGIVNAGIQVEMLGVQLKSLMGDANAGKKALKDILDFAKTTPFELKNIQQGVTSLATVRKQAAAAGISFHELMVITGNTATLLGGDFALASMQIQRAFGSSIGAADLFRDRGVSAMAGFKAGATYNAKESIKGLKNAFGTGGEFGSLMGDLAKTLFGTISNLKDGLFRFQVYVAEGFFGELKKQFGDLRVAIESNEEKIKNFGRSVGTLLSSAIRGASIAMKAFADNIKLIVATLKFLIALKLIKFFYNLATAIYASRTAMLSFNAATKKNLFILGLAAFVSQLDLIIKKIKKIMGLTGQDISAKVPKQDDAITIFPKRVETITEAIQRNWESVFSTIREGNSGALADMMAKMTSIGQTIGKGLNQGIKKFSDALAEAVILGKNLEETFRNLVESIMVKMLSFTIELILRKQIELILEQKKTDEMKKQHRLQMSMMLMSGNPMALFGLTGMAKGGAVSKGKPVVVGERGAEVFVPNSTGQITQNARGTGGESVVVNFNINTIDSRGFDEALYQNRGTITAIINNAVNEKRRRELI